MALIIALNAAFSLWVLVMVIAPLIWAIRTDDHDVTSVTRERQRRPALQTRRPALT